MKEQIIETWMINNRVNLMLIDAISDEGMNCTLSKRGGRTVALQFAHMHNLRLWRLENYAKKLMEGQAEIDKEKEVGKELLKLRLSQSAEAMGSFIAHGVDEYGKIKGFKRGVIPMLGYMIAHEAHHRGNILLTLKQSGHKVPQEIQYGIWDWNRI
jgi:uncharacterized damage-inducible protein DinB